MYRQNPSNPRNDGGYITQARINVHPTSPFQWSTTMYCQNWYREENSQMGFHKVKIKFFNLCEAKQNLSLKKTLMGSQ